MRIKPLRSMVGAYGHIKGGVIVDLDDVVARKLIDAGRAVPVDPAPAVPAKVSKAIAKGAPLNPPEPRRTGGQTGAGKSLSVSEADQAPQKRTSKKSEKPEQS